jgi:hypothetical protein
LKTGLDDLNFDARQHSGREHSRLIDALSSSISITTSSVGFRFGDGAHFAPPSRQVKVRIKKTPREDEVDGIRVNRLEPGTVREVSASIGAWLIAERYAEPEMRRSNSDEEFTTVKDLRDAASDLPRRRRTDF